MRPLPVLLCIDVEPDAFFIDHDRLAPWRGFEAAADWLGTARADLPGDRGHARFTWVFRMDSQIAEVYGRPDWAARHYGAVIERLGAAGDDLGLHAHAYRWDSRDRVWIVDHGNQPWVERCLGMSFEAFGGAFGRPCTTFRFGDRWMNDATMNWLRQAGVRYDLTVEPGQPAIPGYHPGERFTGHLPDYRSAPTVPYRPADGSYLTADVSADDGLWIVPMTTAEVRARWWRRAYYRLFRPWRRGVWTAMLSHEPGLFSRIVGAALADERTRHLALPVRSDVFANPRLMRRVRRNVALLRSHARTRGLTWTTAEEVVSRLRLFLSSR